MSFFRGKRKIFDSKVPCKREYLLVPWWVNISRVIRSFRAFCCPADVRDIAARPRCEGGLLHLEYQERAHHLQRHLTLEGWVLGCVVGS